MKGGDKYTYVTTTQY